MPLTISWQFGAATPISVTFPLTNAKAKAMTARYAKRHGIDVASLTEAQVVEAVIRHGAAEMAREAADTQRADLRAANEDAISATVDGDNAL